MKNFFLIAFVSMMLTSCNNDSGDNILPAYAMEGKWVFPADIPGIGEQGISNTMYLFEDGIRYTYYCTSELSDDCKSLYESFEAADGNHIPGTNNYTFENNILNVDLNFGNELVRPITFECDGGKAYFETPRYSLIRLGSSCD